MEPFFAGLAPETALALAGLSHELYEVRETRKQLLAETDCTGAEVLYAALCSGQLPEHPAYEAWLAVIALRRQEERLREHIDWRCRHPGADAAAPANELETLAAALTLPAAFAPPRLHPDGLVFASADGLEVLARLASPRHWSFEWRIGQAHWRLDTAPLAHPGVSTRAHLHRPDGSVVDDPLRLDEATTSATLQRFLEALARAPAW